ncbi:MAG: hypothetical protein WBF93_08910 [Pirellulales bacterium]
MIDLHGAGPWIVLASGLMFAVSLTVLPIVIIYLPRDYFSSDTPRFAALNEAHPVLRWVVLIVKNLGGVLLIAAGLVMLVTPGQGLLALLVGVMLLDVPAKRKLERKFLYRPSVLRVINRIRARAGRPPLDHADQEDAEG